MERRATPHSTVETAGADPVSAIVDHFRRRRSADAPTVLAFGSDWTLAREGRDAAATRAELRGLGADLVVISGSAVWFFRPDDEVEQNERASDSEIARITERLEVDRRRDGSPCSALFVVDGRGRVRFSFRPTDPNAPVHELLIIALRAAGRELAAAPALATTLSRREWLLAALVSGFALALGAGCERRSPSAGIPLPPDASTSPEGAMDIVLHVNGIDRRLRIDPRVSLLDALRERLGLTGSKKGCDHGQCGACTVLLDDRRVCSCLTLAVMAQGSRITTIEGLARGDELHPMQAAFLSHDAFQCGYCTPGQIMSAVGLVAEDHAHSDDEVREQMSGNLCRCGAYPNIVAAVQLGRRGA